MTQKRCKICYVYESEVQPTYGWPQPVISTKWEKQSIYHSLSGWPHDTVCSRCTSKISNATQSGVKIDEVVDNIQRDSYSQYYW